MATLLTNLVDMHRRQGQVFTKGFVISSKRFQGGRRGRQCSLHSFRGMIVNEIPSSATSLQDLLLWNPLLYQWIVIATAFRFPKNLHRRYLGQCLMEAYNDHGLSWKVQWHTRTIASDRCRIDMRLCWHSRSCDCSWGCCCNLTKRSAKKLKQTVLGCAQQVRLSYRFLRCIPVWD